MATFEPWTKEAEARLSGSTPGTNKSQLIAAVREFYFQSRAWRRQIGPYTVTAGDPLVAMTIDANTTVAHVRSVWIQDPSRGRVALWPLVQRSTEAEDDYPRYYTLESPDVLRLWPTPNSTVASALWVDAALSPSLTANVLPDIAQTVHFDAILDGFLARMLMLPNKPWTNPMFAADYRRSYRRRTVEFRNMADQGYLKLDPPWIFPPFA